MIGKKQVTFFEKIAYGFGDNGLSMSYTIISFFFLFFLTDIAGLNPALAGSVVLIGKLWDAVTDPFCGYLSDRTTTKWGRRRPYFLFSSLPFGISFYLLWSSSSINNQFLLFLFYVLLYIFFTTSYTLYAVPYMSLTPELTTDYDERTSLTAYRMAFSIFGGLIAAAVPMLIVHHYDSPAKGFNIMGAIFGFIIFLSPLVVFWGTREKVQIHKPEGTFWGGISAVLKNRPFVMALTIFLLTWVSLDVISAIFIYYIKYWLLLEGHDSGILGSLFISSVLFLPLWVKVSEKYGKKQAYVTGIGSLAALLILVLLLKPGQIIAIYAFAFLAGIGVSTAHIIPYAIIPDCIDYGQFKNGNRQEGVYYGFTTFSRKVASAIAINIIGHILNITGYVANQPQNSITLWAIRLMLGPISAIILIMGIIIMLYFPINRKKHQTIVKKINI